MSTSSRKAHRQQLFRWLLAGAGVSALLLVFNAVYTLFSYGQSSPYMQWAFLPPLLLCAMPAAILQLADHPEPLSRLGFNLYNGGVAALVCGCLLRGIVDMAGRSTHLQAYYFLAGGILLILGAACTAAGRMGG